MRIGKKRRKKYGRERERETSKRNQYNPKMQSPDTAFTYSKGLLLCLIIKFIYQYLQEKKWL